ncbi:MAG: phosphate/phosphite/phosphonate ABC transporter substrate-binding protein [Pseudomonadota bacterium]
MLQSNLRILGLLLILLLFWGCEKSGDYQSINLTEKMEPQELSISENNTRQLRVAIAAMVSPKETLIFYEELLNYIGKKIQYEINLIQRKTYSEVNELFPKHLIDMAFVCSGPYANDREKYQFEGIATPIVRNKPYYQSYLIVHQDSPYQTLDDLRNKIFAFTDPESNTGSLVPRFWLHEMNETPPSFFNRITFTYSHDNSILAVAKGLVDGAAVDGHKWEFYQAKNPYFTSKTRVIKKSELYGAPPLVASSYLQPDLKHSIQKVILNMHKTLEGQEILNNLMIDRFDPLRQEWYENVKAMHMEIHSKP